jgi:pimeloyl-ACP methyl ester carboxylesterase
MAEKLHTERVGDSDASPLLMLHGWGQSLEKLRPLASLLQRDTSPHLIDLPGFGLSTAPDSSWNTFDYADCLVRYMDVQKLERVAVLGHSFGGKVAMSMAMRYPHRLSALILISSSGLRRRRCFRDKCRGAMIQVTGKLIKRIDSFFRTTFYKRVFIPRFASTDYQQAGIMRPILVRSVNECFEELLKKIDTPTLILWGKEDQETPPEIAYRLQRGIREAQLLMLPYKQHEPFRDVGAHLCAYYIRRFLKR